MTCKDTRKVHILRVIAQLFGVLTVLITAALLAQTIAGRPKFDKPNAAPLQVASTPITTQSAPAFRQGLGPVFKLFVLSGAYGSGGQFSNSIALSDVNHDSKLDLLVTNEGSGTVGVLLGNGDATSRQRCLSTLGERWLRPSRWRM